MKKFILFVVSMVLPIATYAQSLPISIQPKAGLNVAHVTNIDGSGPRYGFVAGAEAEFPLSKFFGISAGLLYSAQGAKVENRYLTETLDETIQTDYLNIPILANIYLVKGLAIKCGVQPAFNVRDNVKLDSRRQSSTSISGKADVKSFDFSIPVGISYEIKNFVVDARYNFGITNIWDEGDEKHSVLQITLGYKFNL